jgi:hypothetical protein
MRWILSCLELLMGLGFGLAIYASLAHGLYGSVPFLSLFMVGFLYVSLLSLLQGRVYARAVPVTTG